MRCERCEAELSPEGPCSRCGQCPSCHAALVLGAPFCGQCGAPVPYSVLHPTTGSSVTFSDLPSLMPSLVASTVGVGIATFIQLAFLLGACLFVSAPFLLVRDCYTWAKTGQYDSFTVYEVLDRDAKSVTDVERLRFFHHPEAHDWVGLVKLGTWIFGWPAWIAFLVIGSIFCVLATWLLGPAASELFWSLWS